MTQNGLPAGLFMAGLVGGFTHCAGMCGPFVIAQTGSLQKTSSLALLPYHAGRMTTYVLLAVLMSTVLNLAFAASPLRMFIAAPMLALAGVIFLATAFPRLESLFPWAGKIRISLPYRWIEAGSAQLIKSPGGLKRYALGVLLGFMPCGLVLSALLAAATAENALYAAMAMAAFALGTVPALMLTAWAGGALGSLFPRFSVYAFRSLMAFNGLWLIAMAGFLLR
ncbi:MAG: sulfite exporter TauE/SafE family protein [Alphaproteobacteria bacterium]|nr:sulfite exporter TauE/SafE family protein [Alphaproteobacteria bacterium]